MHCWLIVRPSYLCRGSYKFMHCERNKPQLQVSSYRNRIRTGGEQAGHPGFRPSSVPTLRHNRWLAILMRYFIALLLLCSTVAFGREPRTLETDSGRVVVHYHRNGRISTVEWTDLAGRYGISYALDAKGKEILRLQTRRFAGHATVHFSYHANGSVALAEYSNAPDAGIQWYRARYRFDESGNQTSFEEQGHDNYGPLPRPGIRPSERMPAPREACQEPVVNTYFIVNPLDYPVLVHLLPKHPSPASKDTACIVYPADTLKGGAWITGDATGDVGAVLDWRLTALKNGSLNIQPIIVKTEIRVQGSRQRDHFLVLGVGR